MTFSEAFEMEERLGKLVVPWDGRSPSLLASSDGKGEGSHFIAGDQLPLPFSITPKKGLHGSPNAKGHLDGLYLIFYIKLTNHLPHIKGKPPSSDTFIGLFLFSCLSS